jgi:hypothetical protein
VVAAIGYSQATFSQAIHVSSFVVVFCNLNFIFIHNAGYAAAMIKVYED